MPKEILIVDDEPSIVVPMYYKVPGLQAKLGSLNRFLKEMGLEKGAYILVTLHRPSNVDQPQTLAEILSAKNGETLPPYRCTGLYRLRRTHIRGRWF